MKDSKIKLFPITGRLRSSILKYLILILLAIYAFVPLIVLGINSFKSNEEVASNPFGLPKTVMWSNYIKAWEIGNFGVTIRNSIFLVSISVIGILIISFLAAYGLARYSPRGKGFFIAYLLIGSAIPAQMYILPLYIALSRAEILDNLFTLAVVNMAKQAPFGAFLIRAFILQISNEFEDAARVDGATEYQVITRVLVPICWPAILTVALVAGLRIWNEFFFAVTFIQSENIKPISTSIFAFQQKYYTDWGLVNAGSIITIVPIIVIFLLLQRQFIEGLTQGGLKG